MIDITGLDKPDVLAALYNSANVQGMGVLHAKDGRMSAVEAAQLLNVSTRFDYVRGRVMKVNLSSDTEFDERLYDRDNGTGAAAKVVDALRRVHHG